MADLFTARRLAWASLGAALLVMLLFGANAWEERQSALKRATADAQSLARVLEDQATRGIDTAALALAALAEVVAQSDPDSDSQLGKALAQSLASLPVLRDVSVLDAQGLVGGSTDGPPHDQGNDGGR
ncbi:MAG: hypothetical protein ACOVOG_11300, partial [Rubrivivax sp.]